MRHGVGLGFALFIIGALLAAFLAVRQFTFQRPEDGGGEEQSAVQAAQGMADELNRRNADIMEELP